MMEQVVQNDIIGLIKRFGDFGIFLAMFLESSIIPIPSEAIIVGAGAIGIPIISIIIFGSLGSTIGGIMGYMLGRYAAMPTILKFGKYIFIKQHHIDKTEVFARKYGAWSVLIGRVLPIIPFKVFSIVAGATKIPLVPFIVCTMVGVLPRIYVLSIFGYAVLKYSKLFLFILFFALLLFLVFKAIRKAHNANAAKRIQQKYEQP